MMTVWTLDPLVVKKYFDNFYQIKSENYFGGIDVYYYLSQDNSVKKSLLING